MTLIYFQYFAIINNVSINSHGYHVHIIYDIYIYISYCTCVGISSTGSFPEVRFQGQPVNVFVISIDFAKLLSIELGSLYPITCVV